MITKSLMIFCLLAVFSIGAYAQSSCSCSLPSGCSASQSCPAGKVAVCICTATGCSSRCDNESPEEPPENLNGYGLLELAKKIEMNNATAVLSKAFGRQISFVPNKSDLTIDLASKFPDVASLTHIDLFDQLAKHGELKINGTEYSQWKEVSSPFRKGGTMSVCTSNTTARHVLREIGFLSGKRLSITRGDPGFKSSLPITGNSLIELLAEFSRTRGVTVAEN